MTKAAEMAKVSAKGSFHIMWGLVASTVISAVGTIYLANLLSSEELGLYALATAAPALIGVFRDWGVSAALIRYTAQYNSENQFSRIRKILVSGLVFEVTAGVILTAVSFLFSSLFGDLYQIAAITPLIQVVSFTILINAFLTVAQSAFTGFERMELNSVTLILQSIVKAFLTPGLVILGLGVFGAVLGFTFAFLTAGVTGTLLLWVLYRRIPASISRPSLPSSTSPARKENDFEIKVSSKMLLKYGLPLSIAAIISTFQTQFYTIMMGIYVTTSQVGNYSLAMTFLVLISFFSTPITTMLFPAFSKLDPQKDQEALKSVFQFSVKYAALLVVPVAAIVMALSGPAISTLFGNKYTSAPLFLALLALGHAFTAFGSLTASNLLNGQGKTGFNLKLSILSAAIGFPLSVLLTWQFGVIGIIITILTAGIPGLVVSLHWIKKHYNLTIDWASSAKILLCSALAGVAAFAFQLQLAFSSWMSLLIGAAVFCAVLLPSILITQTINKSDIENLRQMTASIGVMSRLLSPVLSMAEKFLSMISKSGGEKTSSLPTDGVEP